MSRAVLIGCSALAILLWLGLQLISEGDAAMDDPVLELRGQAATLAPEPDGGPIAIPDHAGDQLDTLAFGDREQAWEAWFGALEEARTGAPARAEALRQGIRMRLMTARPEVVPELLGVAGRRTVAVEVLPLWMDVRGAPSSPELAEWLDGRSVPVRSAAYLRLARLGVIGRERLTEALARESEDAVGAEALAWLFQRGARDALGAIESGSSDEELVRRAILAAMIAPEAPGTADALRDLLGRPLPYRHREALADALAASYPEGLRNTPTSRDDLMSRATDADPLTRSLALRNAGDFVQQWRAEDPDPNLVLGVRDTVRQAAIGDSDPLVRRAAILSRIGLRPGVADLGVQCQALLELCGDDPDAGVRAAVLRRIHRGCAHARPPFAPNYLRSYLRNDPDPDVRVEALRTLPRYQRTPDWQGAARELLREALRDDPDAGVRLEAAARLSELGWEEAREAVRDAALNDRDPSVRDMLYETLRDQVGEHDRELVEELARLRGIPRDAIAWGTITAGEGPRLSFERTAPPIVSDEEIASGSERITSEGPRGEATRRVRSVWLEGGRDLPALHGMLHGAGETARPLVVLLPTDPLVSGVASPFPRQALIARLVDAGSSVLVPQWRGTGRSEGFVTNPEEDTREDLTRWHAELASDAGPLSGLVPSGGVVTWVTCGPAVSLLEGLVEEERVLAIAPVTPLPTSPRAAMRRALPGRAAESIEVLFARVQALR